MDTTTDTTEYTARLRALIDGRMAAVDPLAERAAAVTAARAALDEATHAYTDAWADALDAGWSEPELRKVFKDVAVEPAPRRRRGPRTRTATASATPPQATTSAPVDTHNESSAA